MRLQGAIFDGSGAVLDEKGNALSGIDRTLSLLKMEDVWLYLVCDGDPDHVRADLEGAGVWKYFRGILSAAEHGGDPLDPELYEKAVRRLRTAKQATLVFTNREELLFVLKKAGFYVALVGTGHSHQAVQLADETIACYQDMTV